MAEESPLFTVFTSAFNAERTLHRVYQSLRSQTLRSFEWVVVSDGSVDGTEGMVEEWQTIAPFPIRLERQAHSGTAASFNRAISIARGELFFQIDHDDGCKPHALRRLWKTWREIPEQARPGYAGMYVRSCDENGRPNGPGFGVPWRDATFHEQYYRFRAREDQRPCWATGIIRRFPAPILQDFSGWLPEGLTQARVGRFYRARWLNEDLYVYYQADHGRVSLQRNGSGSAHWPGLRAQYQDQLARDAQWLRYAPVQFYRRAAAYSRFSFRMGIGPAAQWREVGTPLGRALWLTALPVGLALNLMDQAQGR